MLINKNKKKPTAIFSTISTLLSFLLVLYSTFLTKAENFGRHFSSRSR